MRKLFLLLLIASFISPALAKNEAKHAVKSIDKALDGGKGGKPLVPGAEGRVNSEIKKATNPGKGGGKNNGLGGDLLDDLGRDNGHNGNHKSLNNGNNKSKNKGKNKGDKKKW